MVSFRVSPFDELVVAASENPITLPPSLFTAVSKLRRVLVEVRRTAWLLFYLPEYFCKILLQTWQPVLKVQDVIAVKILKEIRLLPELSMILCYNISNSKITNKMPTEKTHVYNFI